MTTIDLNALLLPNFSFEFFPPRTAEGMARLDNVTASLVELGPSFFSVTYGAGGSTRENTRDTVVRVQKNSDIPVAPHLSCIGSTRESLKEILQDYINLDIKRIVALRGDLPSGARDFGDFRYASELVNFIRQETGDHFYIEVACYPEFHPQARSSHADLKHFKEKVNAGADSAITQYFYNIDAYLIFVEECENMGIFIPIIPGVMPINNYQQLARFSDACGAEIPRWIRRRLEYWQDDLESLKAFGLDVVTRLCDDLLDQGAPGIHFYTMNQAEPMLTIWDRLDLANWGSDMQIALDFDDKDDA